jgi:hypothetical protein
MLGSSVAYPTHFALLLALPGSAMRISPTAAAIHQKSSGRRNSAILVDLDARRQSLFVSTKYTLGATQSKTDHHIPSSAVDSPHRCGSDDGCFQQRHRKEEVRKPRLYLGVKMELRLFKDESRVTVSKKRKNKNRKNLTQPDPNVGEVIVMALLRGNAQLMTVTPHACPKAARPPR